jgi:hypothetical protein
LHFFDGVLAPWEHLTSNREAIHARLAALYGERTAQRAVTYIYDYADLNRLCEEDYLTIVRESGFSKVLLLRRQIGRAPNVPGASSTREFLMVLKKGPVSHWEKASCLARFAFEFGSQQIQTRVLQRVGEFGHGKWEAIGRRFRERIGSHAHSREPNSRSQQPHH